MALFGDLEHHALTDLAKVLKPQTGTLFFHQAYQGRTLELTLMQGRLRAMYLDGFLVREQAQVREILRQLHGQGWGAFEFQRQDFPVRTAGPHDLPLVELLQEFAEAFIPQDQLPHPGTRFIAATGQPVPPALSGLWALLQPHLLVGAGASDLAGRVGHSERDVLVMLHRLRAVDLIVPQRAAAPQSAALPEQLAAAVPDVYGGGAPPASAPLVRRLLGALRRLTGMATT